MFKIAWRTVFCRKRLCRAATAVIVLMVTLTAASSVLAESDEVASFGCYCVGTVGNVNCDYRDEVTLGDVALLVDHLFISGIRLPNLQEANINGDPEGEITTGDVAMLIDHLFISGVELPDCPGPYNTPPETRIVDFIAGVPFINSVEPYSPVVGLRFRWTASDIVDHPYTDPEFEYEYRVYGPYNDSLLEIVTDSFVVSVFRHNDGRMFRFGQNPPEFFVACDTAWLPGGVPVILCDTIVADSIDQANIYGILDTLFDFEHPDFVGNPDLNRLVVISDDGGDPWITAVRDSLYDVYADYPSDTTVEMNFIFTVRARESAVPAVVDPTPAFRTFTVIDPKHERDILVMNWSYGAHENRALEDSVGAYWGRAIDSWTASNDLDDIVHFDPEGDFEYVSSYMAVNRMLRLALKYKVMIHVQDAAVSGSWSVQGEPVQNIMVAMQTGVNVWSATRVPLGSFSIGAPVAVMEASDGYEYFFGVDRYYFPGWGSSFFDPCDGYGLPRTEDFIGANPDIGEGWPEISIDTAFLHHRYCWEGSIDPLIFPFIPFLPDPGALPQVGWCEPTEDAEVLYRYMSCYGEGEHPYEPARDFHGKPVMHRLDRGLFRSVHSVFTPLALEETTGQQMVDSVLNWLYGKWLPVQVSDKQSGIAEELNKGGTK